MRHKYETRGIVLSRTLIGEASSFVTLLTAELGVVRVLVQSVRKTGAKLAPALVTFAESSFVLVRGRDGWRLAGAVLEVNWFKQLTHTESRQRAGRICGLLLRLVPGEAHDSLLFSIVSAFFKALSVLPLETHEAVEILAALRIVTVLGFEKDDLPEGASLFAESVLVATIQNRTSYIARINQGIAASGL